MQQLNVNEIILHTSVGVFKSMTKYHFSPQSFVLAGLQNSVRLSKFVEVVYLHAYTPFLLFSIQSLRMAI